MAKIIEANGSDEWFARQRETAEVGAAAIENIFEGRAAEAAAEQARKERRERFRTRLAVIGLIVAVLALIVAVLAIAITAGWITVGPVSRPAQDASVCALQRG
jgi:hypothetical protein